MRLDPALASLAMRTKGFMADDEAAALREAAAALTPGLWLEIGTYCGKSTVHLGAVAAQAGSHLVTLDHHHGSEENQPGWQWHDQSLVDARTGRLDTLPSLRLTLAEAGLESTVSVLVASTQQVAPWWTSPLTLLFLDGNHTETVAQHDYSAFARHLLPGGLLAVHDVFPDPRDGGAATLARRAKGAGRGFHPARRARLPSPAAAHHRGCHRSALGVAHVQIWAPREPDRGRPGLCSRCRRNPGQPYATVGY
jgi:predicted O-methyltransferase YrrM